MSPNHPSNSPKIFIALPTFQFLIQTNISVKTAQTFAPPRKRLRGLPRKFPEWLRLHDSSCPSGPVELIERIPKIFCDVHCLVFD